ncbi:pyridoxal phosphate-dependent decarboxylase family protein [Actinopolyspora mortivallis]|uniref:pyridoxal phosphate-dependent decarboxylase family protein n=1 Tax=Actinopolyspora mortivallis TaxID=33906 RepID=UPI000381385F|nr:aspartate aminotransferase family protein [Actinopolyspora mortivallis]
MSFLASQAEEPSGSSVRPADPQTQLLDERNTAHYRDSVLRGVERVVAELTGRDRPTTGVAPELLEPQVRRIDLDDPLGSTDEALEELERVYLRDAVHFHHPRYLAHLNCPVVIPALLAEAIGSAINSSLDTWDQSAGGTFIERQLIDWTAGRLGLGERADGIFTSGGTQSNLQALLIAREQALAGQATSPETGWQLSRMRILTATDSHFSIVKAAKLLGLGSEAVVPVACDQRRRMIPSELDRELERCRQQGLIPMAVVATAGTTDFGSIDPLPEIAERCAAAGVWMHVDAAYGCGLLVSERGPSLSGIEHADSVVVDYHKSFFQPVSSSAVLVRDHTTLRHVTYHADYLNPEHHADSVPNQVDKSIQTTRRFDALKLWLTLRIMGPEQLGRLFDGVLDLAQQAWGMLSVDPRFEVVTRPELSALVFRYVPSEQVSPELCDRANMHARQALYSSGVAAVAETVVDGRTHLKFTLLNPRTTLNDIAEVNELIAEHAERYLKEPDQAAPHRHAG